MAVCKIPYCRETTEPFEAFCDSYSLLGYDAEYERYRAYLAEHMSHTQAAAMAGFTRELFQDTA